MKQIINISDNETTISRNGNSMFCSNFIGRIMSGSGVGNSFIDKTIG